MNIWAVSTFQLLRIVLWASRCEFLCGHVFSFLWGAHEGEGLLSQMIATFYFLRELDSVSKVTVFSYSPPAMPKHPNSLGVPQPLPFALLCVHAWWLRSKPRALHTLCKLCAAGVTCPAPSLGAAILAIQEACNLLHANLDHLLRSCLSDMLMREDKLCRLVIVFLMCEFLKENAAPGSLEWS